MAIKFTRYIDITSGVAGTAQVARRNLIGRLFTDNNLLPPNSMVQFDTAAEVGTYFGTTSNEYLRAVFYFSFLSKSQTRPQKIQFARWVKTAVAPRIYGNVQTQTLADYTAITAGSIGLTINGVAESLPGINFSGAASLADVASILETAIQTGTGTMYTSATVTYDATRGSFDFVGGEAIDATISVQEGVVGTPIGALLGWTSGDRLIVAEGSAVETVTEVLTASDAASDDFGSFLFMPALSVDEVTEAATWNDGENVKYMFCVPVITANASAYNTAIGELSGSGVTLSDTADEYPEMLPMMIEAATNYNRVNAVQNYMYQQVAGLTPGVTTDSAADTLDGLSINYYGRTQDAGQNIDFYQRGRLMGIATDPLDMNTYVNEIWLKDANGAALMNLLLAVNEVPANKQGRAMILTTLQGVINEALNNGVISVGKVLNETQKEAIGQITNDVNAWYQVQNSGYWLDVVFVSSGTPVEFTAEYTLIYSKDDVIRKVTGEQVLI